MKRFIIFLTISVLALFVFSCQKQPNSPAVQEEVSKALAQFNFQYTDNYIVQYTSSLSVQQVLTGVELKQVSPDMKAEWDEIGFAYVTGVSERDAEVLRKAPNIKSVTRDIQVRWIPNPDELTNFEVKNLSGPTTTHHDPSDAAFFDDFQWNMKAIDADKAWNKGFRSKKRIKVAILDTGINPTHPDLAGLVDKKLSRTMVTASAHAPDLTSFDDFNFHGTHVAGIVATNGIGTSGVAPHTRLVAVKVLSAFGSGSFGDVINGILYAAKIKADVINMSLGAEIPNTPENRPLLDALSDAIGVAVKKGVLVVASAGNEGRKLKVPRPGVLLSVPAQSHPQVAAIAATGPVNQANFDRLASYSNFGNKHVISVGAPGGDFLGVLEDFVMSPCSQSSIIIPVCATGDFYVFVVGTSQAAPHVSGAAAMIDAQKNGKLTGRQLREMMERTADRVGTNGIGHGRLNVFKALKN